MKLYDKIRILRILERVFFDICFSLNVTKMQSGQISLGLLLLLQILSEIKKSETGSLSYLQKHTKMVLAHLFISQTISWNHSDPRNSDTKVSDISLWIAFFCHFSAPGSAIIWQTMVVVDLNPALLYNLRVTTECECSIWYSTTALKRSRRNREGSAVNAHDAGKSRAGWTESPFPQVFSFVIIFFRYFPLHSLIVLGSLKLFCHKNVYLWL